MLVGQADAEPPEYEIVAARELILAVSAAEADVAEAVPNPAHVSPPWYETSVWHASLIWAVLLLTMLSERGTQCQSVAAPGASFSKRTTMPPDTTKRSHGESTP